MFERYTELARRTLFFARYEASQSGSLSIEPAHLLLGLMRENKGATASILARAQITRADLHVGAEPATAATSLRTEIPFTATTKRVLQQASVEADALGHRHIGPAHLLLALLAEDVGISTLVTSRGVTIDEIKKAALEEPEEASPSFSPGMRSLDDPRHRTGKPDIPPSYAVHIVPTARALGTSSTSGPSWLALSGFTLRAALAHLYDIGENRIALPATIDAHARYDIACVPPHRESVAAIRTLVTQGIERHFSLALTMEPQMMDVYVLKADPSGPSGFERSGLGAFSFGSDVPDLNENVLSLFTDILRASAAVSAGAVELNADTYVRKTGDLPEPMLQQLRERFGVVVEPAQRVGLMLIASLR
jgi:hypothetical protein